MRNCILCALVLLLCGCKTSTNRLTPSELEIDASEQYVEVCATRKINKVFFNKAKSYPNIHSSDSEYSNGILTFEESWFKMRVNRNNIDSCNVVKFYIKKNESGEKRIINFRVVGDPHFQTPVGTIIQDIQH
mgnify:CR=1 FL=1